MIGKGLVSTMKVLAIDSSGIAVSAVVADENSIIAEFTVNNRQTHSQTLLPMIDMVVQMSEIPLSDITAIAVAAGPGSFTGLRIGSATAKGLGFALDKPVIPVPSLDGLAYRAACFNGIICPLMDARRNQVYTAAYRMEDGHLSCIIGQKAADITDILSELSQTGESVLFLGDGADVYKKVIEEEIKTDYSFAPAYMSKQSAASVAALGIIYYSEGRYESAAGHRPFYLRKPQAERERIEKLIYKTSINIHRMAMEDLEEVIALESLVFGSHPDIESYKKACMRQENIYMVAKSSNQVIAYCTVVTSYETADLCNIAVKNEYRRNHIAQKLLSECILCCSSMNVKRIMLEVREDNIPALEFYKNMDFKEIGRRKGYYKEPYADAVIMEKSL